MISSGSTRDHNCIEPSPLPFTHRKCEAVMPTSIKANPQAELTPLKQVPEWASSSRPTWLRCTLELCPQMSVMMTVWAVPTSHSQNKPYVVLMGQNKCNSWLLSGFSETREKCKVYYLPVCVHIHWYVYMDVYICICIYTYIYIHVHSHLKQNSSGSTDKERIWTFKTFLSVW